MLFWEALKARISASVAVNNRPTDALHQFTDKSQETITTINECFYGIGSIENHHLAGILRDATNCFKGFWIFKNDVFALPIIVWYSLNVFQVRNFLEL